MSQQESSIAPESAELERLTRMDCTGAGDWAVDTVDSGPVADRPGWRPMKGVFGHMGHSCSDPAETRRNPLPCAIRHWSWERSVAGLDQTEEAERIGLERIEG
jgi:hypothetical protein